MCPCARCSISLPPFWDIFRRIKRPWQGIQLWPRTIVMLVTCSERNPKWTKHNRVIMYRATSPYPAWGLPAEHAWDAGKNAGACNTTKCKNLCGVLSFFEGYCYPGHVKTCPNSLYQQGFWSSPLLFQHLPSVTKTSGGWKNRGNIHKVLNTKQSAHTASQCHCSWRTGCP